MPSIKTISQAIKTEAKRLGFTLVGITDAQPSFSFPHYLRWLDQGYHGQMDYLENDTARQRRSDPRNILPECQSIIVLGTHYFSANADRTAIERSSGQIAAYAWGQDYHEVFKPRLEALVAFIKRQTGHPVLNRWYSDTGPLLERELAQRAGLGWVGKNSMLINPHSGSYFLLAEVLLSIPLYPDQPFEQDLCGSCTACIDACPTSCITAERTLDARRCISYLTIELKHALPAELRPQTGLWVFGCDVCQQVCPWNQRFAGSSGDPAFSPSSDLPVIDLISELSLTNEDFNRKYKGSPVKRAKRRGFLRNVAVALGNQGQPQAVLALCTAMLYDPEPLIRQHAAWALGQIGGDKARQALLEAREVEADGQVLVDINEGLEITG